MSYQQQQNDNKRNQVFYAAMNGKSGTRVIDTTIFGAGQMIKVHLTNKKPDQQGKAPQGRAFLHVSDAKRMYEALLFGRFGELKMNVTDNVLRYNQNAKFYGQGGSKNNQTQQLEARELIINYAPKDDEDKPRKYPYIVEIKNGKGKKPEGQRDGLVMMDGRPEIHVQYYFTQDEFTEFLDSGIRAYERWKLIEEIRETLGAGLSARGNATPDDGDDDSGASTSQQGSSSSQAPDNGPVNLVDEDEL